VNWLIEAASDIGGRSEQQDRSAVFYDAATRAHLVVLADGMGGHARGAAAAQTLLDIAARSFPPDGMQNPQHFLLALCRQAHRAIRRLHASTSAAPGSTCVLLYLRDRQAYWLHVGDSRLYHFQGERLLFQTEDHTVERMMARDPRKARADLDALGKQLYMHLGASTLPQPTTGASALEKQDWFLLCSDGFYQTVDAREASESMVRGEALAATAQTLAGLAAQRGGTGSDNVSLVLARPWRWRDLPRYWFANRRSKRF
jgi:serine/threonine protein phosphatase PrpC